MFENGEYFDANHSTVYFGWGSIGRTAWVVKGQACDFTRRDGRRGVKPEEKKLEEFHRREEEMVGQQDSTDEMRISSFTVIRKTLNEFFNRDTNEFFFGEAS